MWLCIPSQQDRQMSTGYMARALLTKRASVTSVSSTEQALSYSLPHNGRTPGMGLAASKKAAN